MRLTPAKNSSESREKVGKGTGPAAGDLEAEMGPGQGILRSAV